MTDLVLNTAIASYGHTTPLKDGTIGTPMFSMEHTEISPVPMIFRRMVRTLEFDVAEMALATHLCSRAHGKRFTALPVFLTRDFYHGMLSYNARSGIESPRDLEGKRVGVRSYTFTPGVWTRGILQSEYGVDLNAVTWVISGDEHVAEYEAPENVVYSESSDLGEMLQSGEIDAAIGAPPSDSPDIRPLFEDPQELDAAWHEKTGLYPISHLLVVKDALLESNGDLASELFNVFGEAKGNYEQRLHSGDTSAPGTEQLLRMKAIVGGDAALSYDFESARKTLETFVEFNVAQGVIPEGVDPTDLFPSETV